MGFVGAGLLIWVGDGANVEGNKAYAFFVILATLGYATSVNTVKHHFQQLNPVILSATTFAIIGLPALLYLVLQGTHEKLASHPDAWFSLGAATILALLGTVLATIIFYKLVQLTNVIFSSMVSYLIPVTAIFLGFLDGEVIVALHFAGMAMILIGVYLSRDH